MISYTPEDRRRRRLAQAARELYFLIGHCPELFKHVLGPIRKDDMDTLREIAFANDEEDGNAAN
jgi:hypothetical protein